MDRAIRWLGLEPNRAQGGTSEVVADGCSFPVKVSVIVPSYNSEETIDLCLDSVCGQDFLDNFEVIVIDSSTDNTPDIIRSRYPDVLYLKLDKKTDPGTARNIGAGRAQGDILAFIDSDCIARPGWLKNLVSLHQRMEHGVIGGAVENANPESIISISSYIVEFSDFLPTMREGEFLHLPTCNISYKKRVFYNYGGFDSRYYPQEDYYFHWRLNRAGEKIYFAPEVRVAHHHRTRWRSYVSHQLRIGKITSRLLKVTDLPGSGFVRRPIVAAMLIPALPFVKFMRTMIRFAKYEPRMFISRPFSALVILVGLLFWTVGFAQGVYSRED